MEYNIKLNNDDWKHLLIDSQILKVFKGPNSPTSTSTLNKGFVIVVTTNLIVRGVRRRTF